MKSFKITVIALFLALSVSARQYREDPPKPVSNKRTNVKDAHDKYGNQETSQKKSKKGADSGNTAAGQNQKSKLKGQKGQ